MNIHDLAKTRAEELPGGPNTLVYVKGHGVQLDEPSVVAYVNQIRMKIGVMFGNPETTPGGLALKFYSTIRLDIRKAETLKKGALVVGLKTKIRTVKNKVTNVAITREPKAKAKKVEMKVVAVKAIARPKTIPIPLRSAEPPDAAVSLKVANVPAIAAFSASQ